MISDQALGSSQTKEVELNVNVTENVLNEFVRPNATSSAGASVNDASEAVRNSSPTPTPPQLKHCRD